MNTDLLLIVGFVGLLTVFGIVVTFLNGRVLPLLAAYLMANGRELGASLLEWAAETAVQYAEQIGNNNTEKKELAMQFVENELQRYGLDVDMEQVEAVVEAAVQRVLTHFLNEVVN